MPRQDGGLQQRRVALPQTQGSAYAFGRREQLRPTPDARRATGHHFGCQPPSQLLEIIAGEQRRVAFRADSRKAIGVMPNTASGTLQAAQRTHIVTSIA